MRIGLSTPKMSVLPAGLSLKAAAGSAEPEERMNFSSIASFLVDRLRPRASSSCGRGSYAGRLNFEIARIFGRMVIPATSSPQCGSFAAHAPRVDEVSKTKIMRIEHFAYQVKSPAEMADWYGATLGFVVKRGADSPACVRFLADETGRVMLEIYNNPAVSMPDYSAMDPMLLHLAFVCDDVPGEVERLVDAGASLVTGPETNAGGDQLAMLRDPWGFAIQLCHRVDPMV